MLSLPELVRYVDDYLRIREIEDWPNAVNGLQIENSGRITKIGAAVDVSTRVLTQAFLWRLAERTAILVILPVATLVQD